MTKKRLTPVARRLRRRSTDAEKLVWARLRSRQLGAKFIRQFPIGPYIADFACLKARLIIEVDGSQHGNDIDSRRDEVRTRWLNSEGYRVMRFWNNDVTSRIEAVMEAIHDATAVTPPRLPPNDAKHRQGRRPSPSRGGWKVANA